jgi:predicted N-formylglutamate amidohydrolase
VVDCNRQLLDPQAFLEYGDGLMIPGNRGLPKGEREVRAAAVYWPYHNAVAAQIARLNTAGRCPAVLAIHSFTPVLNGIARPWQIGILWDKDARVPQMLMPELQSAGYRVGDNEPYSGRGPQDFTIDYHAEAAGLPHAGIEVRQDLIGDAQGVAAMAAVFQPLLARMAEGLQCADVRSHG